MSLGSFLARMLCGASSASSAEKRPTFRPRLELLEARDTPAAYGQLFAAAAGPSGGPRVQVFSGGLLTADFFAYDVGYPGGVTVAVGDVDGDGIDDVATCSALLNSHVKVFKGVQSGSRFSVDTDSPIVSFYAGLPGGNIALGNLLDSNDPGSGVVRNEIIVGANGGAPRVVVFVNGTSGTGAGVSSNLNTPEPGPNASFYAFSPTIGRGVSVAAGDLDSDGDPLGGRDELVVGLRPGAAPLVAAFDFSNSLTVNGANLNYEDRLVIAPFFAYSPVFTGGVNVAVGNLLADAQAEIITGSGAGAPHVQVFRTLQSGSGTVRGVNLNPAGSVYAFDPTPTYNGGVNVGSFNGAVLFGTGVGFPAIFGTLEFAGGNLVQGGGGSIFSAGFLGGIDVS